MDKGYSVIGKSVRKKDALDKVLGRARFAADLSFPGMLYGAVVRSTIAHGYIKAIHTGEAEKIPGVVGVLTAGDIPGRNATGIIIKDEPILVSHKVRRYEDAVALVAAETKEAAYKAAALVRVEYEELEPVFTVERALEEDSPKVHGTSNILQRKHLERGDTARAFEQCDVVVEHTYKNSPLSHMFIEPEAGAALYENGIVTVYSSTQNPHFDRGEVAAMLNIPSSRVRSVQTVTGGGFGGKLDISIQCHAALIAYCCGRPAKMVRSRIESTLVSSKRHPMVIRARTGATRDGRILAMEAEIWGDTGAYASYGPAVITRAMVHCTGPYEIPNVKIDATFVYTNNPMSGAFRGFGVPQAAAAHEGQMEAVAKALGCSSLELRLKNAQKAGSCTATGQILGDSVGLIECIEKAVEKDRMTRERRKEG